MGRNDQATPSSTLLQRNMSSEGGGCCRGGRKNKKWRAVESDLPGLNSKLAFGARRRQYGACPASKERQRFAWRQLRRVPRAAAAADLKDVSACLRKSAQKKSGPEVGGGKHRAGSRGGAAAATSGSGDSADPLAATALGPVPRKLSSTQMRRAKARYARQRPTHEF